MFILVVEKEDNVHMTIVHQKSSCSPGLAMMTVVTQQRKCIKGDKNLAPSSFIEFD